MHITAINGVTMTAPTRTYHTCTIHSHVVYEKNVKFEQSTVENDDELESIHRGKRNFLVLKIARIWSVLCVISTIDNPISQSLQSLE